MRPNNEALLTWSSQRTSNANIFEGIDLEISNNSSRKMSLLLLMPRTTDGMDSDRRTSEVIFITARMRA